MAFSAELSDLAARAGARLKERGETIAVADGSAGGLISAALLSVPGASAYFVGGAVLYTTHSKQVFLGISREQATDPRSSTEPHTQMLARLIRERLGTTWGLAETGATGPTGNRYGDAAGHCCLAIAGPREAATTIETGQADRAANMDRFACAALQLLLDGLS